MLVRGYFENFATGNSYLSTPFSSTSSNLVITPSIEDVDGDTSPTDGQRQYSYKITHVCDEA